MSKETLAVDIDDVLVPHYDQLAAYLNKVYKTKLVPLDIIRWRTISTVVDQTGATREQIIATVNEFLQSPEFYIDPSKDAPEVLEKLKQKYRIVIITARPTLIQKLTLDWLNQHFAKTFDEVAFVGGADWGSGGKQSDKTKSLRDLAVDILVDDHPRHCIAADEMGIRTIMFGDYGWQTDVEFPNSIEKARNWVEVCALLL